MRCVNETLPPRARDRWLLMTMRLSHSSFTGTERTEVAVGTDRESSMLATVRAGAPRRTVYVGWSAAPDGSGSFFSWRTGAAVPFAGSAAASSRLGATCGAVFASSALADAGSPVPDVAGADGPGAVDGAALFA